MPPHWHKELEIIRVVSGEFTLFLNNEERHLYAGDIFIFGSQTLHRGEPCACVYECIVFDAGMLCKRQADVTDGFISPLASGKSGVEAAVRSDSNLYQPLCRLFDAIREQKPYYELEVSSLLFWVIHQLYTTGQIRSAEKTVHVGKQTRKIIDLLSWIEEHYSEQITLAKLSEVSGLNEKYICRIFKEYTSSSPMNYINELRIEYACHEMSANKKSITTAAYDTGFNDSGYFTKVFKQHKGMTPRQYLRSLTEDKGAVRR